MVVSTSDRVIKNTLYNYAGFGWRLGVSFFLIAYILAKLGEKKFGIFVLLETMVTCLALLDVAGIEGAFVKFIAEFHTKKDFKKVNEIISLGFSYYFTFQLILCSTIYALKEPFLHIFKFNQSITPEINFLLFGFLIIALVRGSLRVFRSTLLGQQRMDLTNLIDIFITVPNLLGTVLFLHFGWGLKGLVINGMIVAFLTVGAQIILVYKISPWIRFKAFSFSREVFREAFFYGLKIQLARFAELINAQVDKLLLGLLLIQNSQLMVGFYELGAKPARSLRDLPSQFLPAILPAASELDARNDQESLKKLYYRGSKYLAMFAMPLIIFAVFNAKNLIMFWLGTSYWQVIMALQVLSIGYMFYLFTGMARLIARGIGIPQYEMRASILITILNVVLSAVLISLFGFTGALLGTAISSISGAIFFLAMFHRYLEQSFWQLIGRTVYPPPLLGSFLGAALCWGVERLDVLNATGRTGIFFTIIVQGVIFSTAYIGVLISCRYFDQYDIQTGLRTWNKIRQTARKTKL